jgi:hypothetical protein
MSKISTEPLPKIKGHWRVFLFPVLVLFWIIGWVMMVSGDNKRAVDPDLLQHMDELDSGWVSQWRRKVQK